MLINLFKAIRSYWNTVRKNNEYFDCFSVDTQKKFSILTILINNRHCHYNSTMYYHFGVCTLHLIYNCNFLLCFFIAFKNIVIHILAIAMLIFTILIATIVADLVDYYFLMPDNIYQSWTKETSWFLYLINFVIYWISIFIL